MCPRRVVRIQALLETLIVTYQATVLVQAVELLPRKSLRIQRACCPRRCQSVEERIRVYSCSMVSFCGIHLKNGSLGELEKLEFILEALMIGVI